MKKYIVLLIIIAALTTGCDGGVYRLVYNSLDTILYRAVGKYIDPNPEQDRMIRQSIGRFLLWHRRDELPNYVVTLKGLRERMARGLRTPDAAWLKARLERHETDSFNAVADDTASILASLDEGQLKKLAAVLGESMTEMEKKSGASREERALETERTVLRMMEFLYGDLDKRQTDAIALGIRQMDDIEAERIAQYRARQAEFLALLGKKPGKAVIRDYLSGVVLHPEKSYPPQYRQLLQRRESMAAVGMIRFDHDLVTAEQRSHAVNKIDMLIQVIRELKGAKIGFMIRGMPYFTAMMP
jgi:hypothetical protein